MTRADQTPASAPVTAASAMPAAMASALPAGPPLSPLQVERQHVHGIDKRMHLTAHRAVEWKSQVLDGPDFRLSNYRGKVVILNIFATWCDACRWEQADLAAFGREHSDDTVIIGIDDGEEDNLVRAYRKKYDITYPIAMDRSHGQVWQLEARDFGYPATIVIRPDGVVSCAWVDAVDRKWLENERLVALLP